MMSAPICIKLHNFKKFKVEHEGQLYELAATSSENLLSEFQKYKPEVKQLLVARPMVTDDFDGLAEGSVVFASTQSYITEAQMHASEALANGPPHQLAIEYKTPSTTSYCSAITNYSPTNAVVSHNSAEQKLRLDLSMVDNFCSPPHGFVEAPLEQGPIDTIETAGRVRDILEKYKISQTLFSKYVIRRSQGTTSDLLRSPKQWDRMSEEGRTPYRRMKSWLEGNLSHNIQTLVRIKQGHDLSHIMPQAFTPKGMRTKFTDEQREALEVFFAQNQRLTHDTLETFARDNNLTISAVRNWVNNRKQRLKRNYTSLDEDGDKLRKMDKQLCLDGGSPQPRSLSAQSSLSSNTTQENEIDCPTGIPTMVNVSTPMFNHENDNMVDRMKTEQENHVTTNVFEAAVTVSKTEPDLEKYFPTPATVWEKSNTA